MATRGYDAIVVGVGGMGSAACYHLAKRGRRVLGLERFGVPNEMGSSHGHTRIIRYAQTDARYVSLVRRSYELWRELEAATGERLLYVTGSVEGGTPGGELFDQVRSSLSDAALPFEVLTGAETNARFPGYRLPDDAVVAYQADSGFVVPERCISAHADAARAAGATIHEGERVVEWNATASGVRVTTDRTTYEADRLVLCAGSWTGKLVPELAPRLSPERQVLMWFQPREPERFTPSRFPVFRLEMPEGRYYGFPSFGIEGPKLGRFHHLNEPCDPDTVDRTVTARDEAVLRDFMERYFPLGAGPALASAVCMFTNTPDMEFVIDRHPQHSQVVVAAGFSGHGFKFCSVVGEICADLVTASTARADISLFRVDRFR